MLFHNTTHDAPLNEREDSHFSQAVLDALPHPVLIKDRNGHYLRCNRELEQWLGLEKEQILGRTLREIAPDEYQDQCLRMDHEVLKDGGIRSCEGRLLLTDGDERQFLALKSPLLGPNGDIDGVVTTFLNISELKSSQRELQEHGRLWNTILNEMQDAVAIIDSCSFRILNANKEFVRLFGTTAETAVGLRCHDLVFPPSAPFRQDGHNLCPLREAILTKKPVVMEHHIFTSEGKETWLDIATSPIFDETGEVRQLVHVCRDITARKEAAKQIEKLAYFDSLTGLPNRTLFLDRLGQALHLARREKRCLGVIFLDLDNFKKINDTLGHKVGDQVLKIVAERLKGNVRKSDTLSRPGGDEFALFLSSAKEVRDILKTTAHFQQALSAPVNLAGMELVINSSVGIALFPIDGEAPDELLKHAELAMYEAKGTGGGTFRFYSREMNSRASKRLQLEVDLRRALREGELFLLYQPQVGAGSGRVTGVEALVRWRHPTLGTISPDQFIPLAEETGLILPMGEWTLRQACLQTRRWQEQGFNDLRLGVNLSPIQFKRSNVPAMVRKVLAETGFDPHDLELEITEGVLLQKDKGRSECLRELKNMGVSLAIDDFGTGYSSLSYLKHFPIDRIKVAQEFVREIPASIEHLEIIRAIAAMARSLKLNVIAEGVETPEQLELITEMGINDIQGFHFSRPLPDEDILPFVRRSASQGGAQPT